MINYNNKLTITKLCMATDNIKYIKFMKILIITTLSILYIICSITSSNDQVVWKSDGTVIDEDGNVKKEGYGARFQKQLSNPTKGWPKASGNGQSPKNYFGNELFIPGTPLLRMSGIYLGSNYIEKIYKLNNFENKRDLYKYIISNANISFLNTLNLSEENAIMYVSANVNVDQINMSQSGVVALMQEKLKEKVAVEVQEKVNKEVSEKVTEKVQEQVVEQVQEQVEEQVQEQVEEQLQEQIGIQVNETVDQYFDRLEAEYKAKGWTVCSRTESTLTTVQSDNADFCP